MNTQQRPQGAVRQENRGGGLHLSSWMFFVCSGVLFLIACLMLNFALGDTVTALQRTLLILATLTSLTTSILMIVLKILSENKEPNYFLYDARQKQNLPAEALTFARVNDRMNAYVARLSESQETLWSPRYLETRCSFGRGNVFRPMVVYKMLYDLSEQDNEEGWRCFRNAAGETVAFLCSTLSRCGDAELAKTLQYLKSAYPNDVTAVRRYLVGNRDRLKARMVRFVAAHLEWYY